VHNCTQQKKQHLQQLNRSKLNDGAVNDNDDDDAMEDAVQSSTFLPTPSTLAVTLHTTASRPDLPLPKQRPAKYPPICRSRLQIDIDCILMLRSGLAVNIITSMAGPE
jgi:hypothetical protein